MADREATLAVIGSLEALSISQELNINWPYVYDWSAQHGTRALLDEIRRSIPPL